MYGIEMTFDLPIDLRGYIKYILPFILFGVILIIGLGINVIFN